MTEKILEQKEFRLELTLKEITHDTNKCDSKEGHNNAILNFENCPWGKFSEIASSGNARKYFKVGDKKTILLKNGEMLRVAIADFDHDVSEEGEILPVTLTFVDCLKQGYQMNKTATNKSGWKGCAMRTHVMGEIYELLPDDLKAIISNCQKDNSTIDKLFLPSETEVWGKNFYGKDNESNKQYEFFKDKYNRIKFRTDNEEYSTWWWLRSPYLSGSVNFCYVSSDGSSNCDYATYTYGVAPCFAIA